jgi:AraC-like DNA-binding protein
VAVLFLFPIKSLTAFTSGPYPISLPVQLTLKQSIIMKHIVTLPLFIRPYFNGNNAKQELNHKKELLLRDRKLLELRRQLQNYNRSSLEASLQQDNAPISENPLPNSGSALKAVEKGSRNPSIPLENSLENAFVIKVMKAIQAHLDSPDFDVEKLCRHLAMSHSQVHRKLSALTGLSATHFIRYVRLVKAKEMINSSGYRIAAIAMECGFYDPAYFSRVFKQEFGVTPQGWREKNSG